MLYYFTFTIFQRLLQMYCTFISDSSLSLPLSLSVYLCVGRPAKEPHKLRNIYNKRGSQTSRLYKVHSRNECIFHFELAHIA